jgi:glyoxylase-like metal-dependent hydrolase (beta-lactamase superfamily II)
LKVNQEAIEQSGNIDSLMIFSQEVLPDLLYMRTLIANLCMVGEPKSSDWILVDAGVSGFADEIIRLAETRFLTPPKAIILTHGHFDHVGSLEEILRHWDVPVYAHRLEIPHLTGKEDYPPADPTVGGGLMALVSPFYPNKAIQLGDRVKELPSDHSVPGLPDWSWIHTPGHTKGHISLFRKRDRVLIAGDAFITVKQESALAVFLQEKEVHGPPAYFTTDWQEAEKSVRNLEALKPAVAVTGHGRPMEGEDLAKGLSELVRNFTRLTVPNQGRYVH